MVLKTKKQAERDSYPSQNPPALPPAYPRDRINPEIFENFMKKVVDQVNTGLAETSKEMHGRVEEMLQIMGEETIKTLEKKLNAGREAIKEIQALEVEEETMQNQISQYTSRVRQAHTDIFPKVNKE